MSELSLENVAAQTVENKELPVAESLPTKTEIDAATDAMTADAKIEALTKTSAQGIDLSFVDEGILKLIHNPEGAAPAGSWLIDAEIFCTPDTVFKMTPLSFEPWHQRDQAHELGKPDSYAGPNPEEAIKEKFGGQVRDQWKPDYFKKCSSTSALVEQLEGDSGMYMPFEYNKRRFGLIKFTTWSPSAWKYFANKIAVLNMKAGKVPSSETYEVHSTQLINSRGTPYWVPMSRCIGQTEAGLLEWLKGGMS